MTNPELTALIEQLEPLRKRLKSEEAASNTRASSATRVELKKLEAQVVKLAMAPAVAKKAAPAGAPKSTKPEFNSAADPVRAASATEPQPFGRSSLRAADCSEEAITKLGAATARKLLKNNASTQAALEPKGKRNVR